MTVDAYHAQLIHDAMDKDWIDYLQQGVEIVAPVLTLIIGIMILRLTKRLEESQWRSQKLIERRMDEWNAVRGGINDIYCYCLRIGNWKEVDPKSIIDKKRVVDRCMYLAQPYFSDGLHLAYQSFIHTCFAHYQGHGVDAKIKSSLQQHKTGYSKTWDNSWDVYFSDQPSPEDSIRESYKTLISKVAEDISLRK